MFKNNKIYNQKLITKSENLTFKNINNPNVQSKLLNFRKELLISKLALRLRDAKKPNNSIFNIWMKEESDTVQQLAHSYFDHVTLIETIKNENNCDSSVKIYNDPLLIIGGDIIESPIFFIYSIFPELAEQTIINPFKVVA